MKLQVLKYYRSVQGVIKKIHFVGICLFLLMNSIYGQESPDVTYSLISNIISQDTVVPDWRYKSLEQKVLLKQITKEDSSRYVNSIKNRALLLYKYQPNKKLKELLELDLKNHGKVSSFLSTEKLSNIIRRIPGNNEHDFFRLSDKIDLIGFHNNEVIYHSFSEPIEFDTEQYLIYHFRSGEALNSYLMEFIIFRITSNGYLIDKNIVLNSH